MKNLSIMVLSLMLAAPALADLPQFDTQKYCRGVSEAAGGSYAIEASCVDIAPAVKQFPRRIENMNDFAL